MKNALIILVLGFSTLSYSQTTIMTEGFEGTQYPPSEWIIQSSTTIGQTPVNQTFPNFYDTWFQCGVGSPSPWDQPGFVHSGNHASATGGTISNPDPYYDWLITDTISLPSTTADLNLNYWMWYQSSTPNNFTEFYVMVQEIGTSLWIQEDLQYHNYSTFGDLYYDTVKTVNLNAYQNKSVRIAFVKNGTYQFVIDDISITEELTTSITENILENSIIVFPNPTSGFIKINTEESIKGINLFDINGRELGPLINNNVIDLSFFRSGIYILNIELENGTFVRKEIIKK